MKHKKKRINRAINFRNTICHFTPETVIKLTLLHVAVLYRAVFHLKGNETVPAETDQGSMGDSTEPTHVSNKKKTTVVA